MNQATSPHSRIALSAEKFSSRFSQRYLSHNTLNHKILTVFALQESRF
jgi:hypothetical protein